VHGSLDRAKDVSSIAFVTALVRRRCDECVRFTHADDVPLLVLPEDTCCRRCDRLRGNEPRYRRFGPTKTHAAPSAREGWRHPVNQGAFHRCDRGHPEGFLLPVPATASRSRRPHVAPMAGDNVLIGHCKRHPRDEPGGNSVAPCVATSRQQVAFTTLLGASFPPDSLRIRAWV
jgi:hypothetical protein